MNVNQPRHPPYLTLPFTKTLVTGPARPSNSYRMPLAKRLPDAVRNHFVAMSGEYVGTVLFLYFALSGAQVANSIPSAAGLTVAQTGSNPSQLLYIALCFGFSLAVNAWVFFRISGGLFNPAVTFGMCLIGALPWLRGLLLFIAQILGGITAAALVSCMFPGVLNVRTKLGGGTSIVQGLFIEMILTAELVFTIFMLAAEKHKGTFIAPVGIGLSLFIAELTGVYFTGGSLNPARSFGPCVVIHSFEHYHWIYWVGPLLGAIVAAGFYKFIKILEYETANPGQVPDESIHGDRHHRTSYDGTGGGLAGASANTGGPNMAGTGNPLDAISEAPTDLERGSSTRTRHGYMANGDRMVRLGILPSPKASDRSLTDAQMSPTMYEESKQAGATDPVMNTHDQGRAGLAEGGVHPDERFDADGKPLPPKRSYTGSRRQRILAEGST